MAQEFAQDIEEYCQKFSEVFEDIYDDVKKYAKDRFNDADNLIDFLMVAMRTVAKHGELHGFDKKELVRDVVNQAIVDMTISDEDKDELRHKVAPYLDHTVEVMIAAAKGYLFLQKVKDELAEQAGDLKECCQGCCLRCKKQEPKIYTLSSVPTEGGVDDLGVIIYEKLRKMISTKHVTINNVISIVGIAMQLVQQYPTLQGAQKKQIVKNVIYRLIDEIPMSEIDKMAVKAFLNSTLDKTIDYIISIANGEIDLLGEIEKVVDKCSVLCAKCKCKCC